MSKKRYKITIDQSIEVPAETEQEAKEYVAENILDLVNWGEVEATERREER